MRGGPPFLTVTAVVLVVACGPAETSTLALAETDSLGISIVESSAPLWREGQDWELEPEPAVSIGN